MAKTYDIIIVGSGPSSIFAALTLLKAGIDKIAIFEKGKDLPDRSRNEVLCGWGGAGAFSDGKLVLSAEIGGFLNEFQINDLQGLINEVDEIYCSAGADSKIIGDDLDKLEQLRSRAKIVGLNFIPTRVRHLGTEICEMVLNEFKNRMKDADIHFENAVEGFFVENKKISGVYCDKGTFLSKYVICGAGRSGSEWVKNESKRLDLSLTSNPVDIGVRVEVPCEILEEITSISRDAKFVYYSNSFDDRVRTFCMNPNGDVIIENADGFMTVNGHSYHNKKTDKTNFAVLVSIPFKNPPFQDSIGYGKYVARLANMLGNGVIIQRLNDLLSGRKSTLERINKSIIKPSLNANPGDLSLALPYRYLKDIIEMLEVLDKLAPGIISNNTLLYGTEVKFYTNRIKLSDNMETEIENLFFIGDGAGITRGLVQASASGILAANEIIRRLK
jgi:hypothetical protein